MLELNQRNVTELSELDPARLERLVGAAFRASVIGLGEAFLIAFDQSADYDSANFHWFRSRFARFVYVDRVVVAESARGRGLASRLYRDLFDAAGSAGHSVVACEINIDPPNTISDAFHAWWGFGEVGCERLSSRKTVRYLTRLLDRD